MPVQDPLAAIALLDEPTRRRLYEFIAKGVAPAGRDAAATALGISRELAAFHLDRLVAGGLLVTEYRRLSGRTGPGAGRPAKLYRRAHEDIAVSLPPRHYEFAAELFAEVLDELDRSASVAATARARGAELGQQARRSAGPRPSRGRLVSALMDLLRERGFEPEFALGRGAVSQRNCPYQALSDHHRELTCSMNRAWADGVVAGLGHPKLAARPIPPDPCCIRFELAVGEAPPSS